MSLNPKANMAAAEYLSELAKEFAPDVVNEFRDLVIEMDQDTADRSKDLMDLIENHDVANDPRTMEAFIAALRGDGGGEETGGEETGGEGGDPDEAAAAAGGSGDAAAAGAAGGDSKIPAEAGATPDADAEDADGAKEPYKIGDYVRFAHGEGEHEVHGEGEIVAAGDSGVRVRTEVNKEKREHTVHHGKLRGKLPRPVKKADVPLVVFAKSLIHGHVRQENGRISYVAPHMDARPEAASEPSEARGDEAGQALDETEKRRKEQVRKEKARRKKQAGGVAKSEDGGDYSVPVLVFAAAATAENAAAAEPVAQAEPDSQAGSTEPAAPEAPVRDTRIGHARRVFLALRNIVPWGKP